MSYKIIDNSFGRVLIHPDISEKEIKEIAINNKALIIQFAEPLPERVFDNLNNYVFSKNPDIELRVYGHYSKPCDLSFLKKFTYIKKFSADCLMTAKNIEYITSLENLEELSIDIFDLTSFDFLNNVNIHLKKILIGNTRSKKPSIEFLSRFSHLQSLYIEGQTKGIEEVRNLKQLQKIVLRSVTTENLDFLKALENLWSVDIKLGGIKDFSALIKLSGIKYLELWQINQLADISFISELIGLQNLYIQSLKNVKSLPDFRKNVKLRRIYLENLKGLQNLNSLKNAPELEDFIYVLAQNQSPENLIPVIENKKVKKIFVRFGSNRKNDAFDNLVIKSQKELYNYYDFKYE
jgi:hypothetical protein